MKKLLTFCLIILTLGFTGCRPKSFTSYYSIGCLGYSGFMNSDWVGFQHYMDSLTTYNTMVSFSNPTLEDNNTQAINFFDGELAKIKESEVCTFIANGDCVIYGIGSSIDSTNFDILKAVRIYHDHIEPYSASSNK